MLLFYQSIILSILEDKYLCKAYIHGYVCEIVNADTHTNIYAYPHVYPLREKYLFLLSVVLRGFLFLCNFFF